MGAGQSCNAYQEILDDKFYGVLDKYDPPYKYIKDDQYDTLKKMYIQLISNARSGNSSEKPKTEDEIREFIKQLDGCLALKCSNTNSQVSAPPDFITKPLKTLYNLQKDTFNERQYRGGHIKGGKKSKKSKRSKKSKK
jgi:hypothetical protein